MLLMITMMISIILTITMIVIILVITAGPRARGRPGGGEAAPAGSERDKWGQH